MEEKFNLNQLLQKPIAMMTGEELCFLITKSVEYQRDVVPIFFGGRNSDRFYRIARFSDKYVKKVNIAMLFLVDEMYRNVGKTFRVAIGKPIPWQTFDKSRTSMEWAKYVEDMVYEL